MLLPRHPLRRRSGATTVETALVISVFLIFMFGIFEYARFLFFMHLAQNSCRDAARYAVVNVDKPSNFDYVDVTTPNYYKSIKGYVDDRMATNDKMLTGYTVVIFPCDPVQMALTPPIVARKPVSAAPTGSALNPTSPYTTNLAWNVASFSERICVQMTGTYKPVVPNLIFMKTTYSMFIQATVGSEG